MQNQAVLRWKHPEDRRTSVHENDGVAYLTFSLLEREDWLVHAFSTRRGGISTGELASMNFSFDREKKTETVVENFRRFSSALGLDVNDLVLSDQTHTTNLMRVDESFAGMGVTREKPYRDVDGMMTNAPGPILVTTYADCVPLLFADPKKRAVALSHAGWRGTAGDMAGKTVERMREEFNSEPSDLLCVIGPSICADCYEVGEEVALRFPEEIRIRMGEEKFHINLWEANRRQLLAAGLSEEHIHLPDLCTCCNPQFLFSHRATGGRRGLLGAFLGIRL